MCSILDGKLASFDEVAATENLGERYARRLAVLAYLSPKIIQAIADGVAPNGMMVSGLTGGPASCLGQAGSYAWAELNADQYPILNLIGHVHVILGGRKPSLSIKPNRSPRELNQSPRRPIRNSGHLNLAPGDRGLKSPDKVRFFGVRMSGRRTTTRKTPANAGFSAETRGWAK